MPVLSGAEPLTHDGSEEVGVLLGHGFVSSPQSMRSWGEHLAAEGITVRCPWLPGHGTIWQALYRTRWNDWHEGVKRKLSELRRQCQSVFTLQKSMSGTLALRLTQCHPGIVDIVLGNPLATTLRRAAPLLPLVSRIPPAAEGISSDILKRGAGELAYGRLPLQAMDSRYRLWRMVRAKLATVRQPILLFRSATDHDTPAIFTGSVDFAHRVHGEHTKESV